MVAIRIADMPAFARTPENRTIVNFSDKHDANICGDSALV